MLQRALLHSRGVVSSSTSRFLEVCSSYHQTQSLGIVRPLAFVSNFLACPRLQPLELEVHQALPMPEDRENTVPDASPRRALDWYNILPRSSLFNRDALSAGRVHAPTRPLPLQGSFQLLTTSGICCLLPEVT